MPKLWADEGRAGVAGVHMQPCTLYQDEGDVDENDGDGNEYDDDVVGDGDGEG